MKDNRIHNIKVRVTSEELSIIKRKCELAHCRSMSVFIRRMVLYGVGVVFPDEYLKMLTRSVNSATNNINQIVMRYHATNQIYEQDMQDLQESAARLESLLSELHSKLKEIKF